MIIQSSIIHMTKPAFNMIIDEMRTVENCEPHEQCVLNFSTRAPPLCDPSKHMWNRFLLRDDDVGKFFVNQGKPKFNGKSSCTHAKHGNIRVRCHYWKIYGDLMIRKYNFLEDERSEEYEWCYLELLDPGTLFHR